MVVADLAIKPARSGNAHERESHRDENHVAAQNQLLLSCLAIFITMNIVNRAFSGPRTMAALGL